MCADSRFHYFETHFNGSHLPRLRHKEDTRLISHQPCLLIIIHTDYWIIVTAADDRHTLEASSSTLWILNTFLHPATHSPSKKINYPGELFSVPLPFADEIIKISYFRLVSQSRSVSAVPLSTRMRRSPAHHHPSIARRWLSTSSLSGSSSSSSSFQPRLGKWQQFHHFQA